MAKLTGLNGQPVARDEPDSKDSFVATGIGARRVESPCRSWQAGNPRGRGKGIRARCVCVGGGG